MLLKKNRVFIFTLFLLVISLIVGCSVKEEEALIETEGEGNSSKYPIEITDDSGTTVIFNSKPERIVSLSPSHTEIMYALELDDNIVGVTTYCDYPVEAQEKPKVGDAFTLNLERIIELGPEMVINYWPMDESAKNQLMDAGIKVVTFSPESIDNIISTIEKIGLITDKEDKAKKLVEAINNKKNEIANKVKDIPKPKVFYEIEYNSALWTVGYGSFIDEMITLAGGENIAKDAKEAYSQYSVEALIEKNPEIYITNTFNIQSENLGIIKERPGYENIQAIKDNRIEILDGNLLSRPSHRVAEALELMAKAIHPEIFE